MIRRTDRISHVLERDERLVEVLISASPHFERLRSGTMRRVMTRLVTVEQAARIAGVDAGALLERLNEALGEPPTPAAEDGRSGEINGANDMTKTGAEVPPVLARTPPEHVVDLDVRDDLRNGKEPFSRIMAAKHALPAGHVLRIRAIFEPAPLYGVMRGYGFSHWTERFAADDWRVWFYPAEVADAVEDATAAGEPPPAESERNTVVLDVRGMEPPEPMARTLAALESLPPGATLVQINVRVPRFLLPKLKELGFDYEVREQSDELVRLFIRRRDER